MNTYMVESYEIARKVGDRLVGRGFTVRYHAELPGQHAFATTAPIWECQNALKAEGATTFPIPKPWQPGFEQARHGKLS